MAKTKDHKPGDLGFDDQGRPFEPLPSYNPLRDKLELIEEESLDLDQRNKQNEVQMLANDAALEGVRSKRLEDPKWIKETTTRELEDEYARSISKHKDIEHTLTELWEGPPIRSSARNLKRDRAAMGAQLDAYEQLANALSNEIIFRKFEEPSGPEVPAHELLDAEERERSPVRDVTPGSTRATTKVKDVTPDSYGKPNR
jgi:hypothetical protein